MAGLYNLQGYPNESKRELESKEQLVVPLPHGRSFSSPSLQLKLGRRGNTKGLRRTPLHQERALEVVR
ncbi:hypothetical protein CDL15_Pgr009742 [Punica granatum]|uniref:Uncharacterized protein n=1 Tax=Punica granatum TaxID=22663 RepID=A0A218WU25_PUNGR|nr:hypothetical protein CDL15_Pgr009742 [Punica granatum]